MAIELKLIVDKKKQKVVFAECEAEFVDVLFSFFTLPLGRIVKLFDKKSELGCMDKLYESIEYLDANKYLQTSACKNMLLEPRSSAAIKCEGLAVNICNELKPRTVYCCSNWECACKNFPHYSSVSGVKCICGQLMNKAMGCGETITKGGVFIKEAGAKFLVSDDLHVFVVSSLSVAFPFLEHDDIKDSNTFQVRITQVDKSQILQLLKRALLSQTPFTDVFMGRPKNTTAANIALSPTMGINTRSDKVAVKRSRSNLHKSSFTTKVKIYESKKVKLLEAGNDFTDFVFSFLTLPLGQAISLMGESCSLELGCIHNLYRSIDDMNIDKCEEILTAEDKEILLHTKLPSYFGCESQLFEVDEIQPRKCYVKHCKDCFISQKSNCVHEASRVPLTELNQKSVKAGSINGGGFTRTSAKFIITSDMIVKPISIISTMQFLKNIDVSVSTLKERVVTIDETKASSFLKACLTSSTGIIDSLLK